MTISGLVHDWYIRSSRGDADEFRTLGNAVRIVIAPDTFKGSLPVASTSCNGETFLPGVVATDLDTEHGGTEANWRDGARQLGRLNVDDLQL